MTTISSKFQELVCGATGHDYVKHFKGTKIFLECVNCSKQTGGMDIPNTLPMPMSNRDFEDVYQFMLDHEMSLGFGG